MLKVSVIVDTTKILGASAKLKKRLNAISQDTANKIKQSASDAAPVATGMLESGIYTVGNGNDGYSDALNDVLSIDPQAERKGLTYPQITEEKLRPGEVTIQVACLMTYGGFVEYGTVKAGAEPFLNPAVEKHSADHTRQCLQAVEEVYS